MIGSLKSAATAKITTASATNMLSHPFNRCCHHYYGHHKKIHASGNGDSSSWYDTLVAVAVVMPIA
ncbi:unnamed protein product [Arabidopsis thaliana]|uniref:At5g08220 n=2 Tax=Arabidopsis thaliana TaxID=3702 RepID=Q6DBH5_ARATH|nr:At5g08220 [Arabidopsis thaliana]CAD5331149.1 unnamed protein product [Arabidopsis thaliana]